MMHIEPSRDPDRKATAWQLPPNLKGREALHYFETNVKPRSFSFERWKYTPHTGLFVTV